MGSLFGGYDPPPPAEPAPDPAAEENEARKEDLDRRRRGRQGLIATSVRGVLQAKPSAPVRKSPRR